jgi:hypothetical protein
MSVFSMHVCALQCMRWAMMEAMMAAVFQAWLGTGK